MSELGQRPRIAILGWGSLIWDKRPEFDEKHAPWEDDGPALKRICAKADRQLFVVVPSPRSFEATARLQTKQAWSDRRRQRLGVYCGFVAQIAKRCWVARSIALGQLICRA